MANTRRDSARERRWRGTLISGGYFIKLLTTNSQFAKPAENSSTAVLPPPLQSHLRQLQVACCARCDAMPVNVCVPFISLNGYPRTEALSVYPQVCRDNNKLDRRVGL